MKNLFIALNVLCPFHAFLAPGGLRETMSDGSWEDPGLEEEDGQ